MTNQGWGTPPVANAEAGAAETPEQFNARRDAEILSWRGLKQQLDFYKLEENKARLAVTATLFPTPKKGTQRYELGAGYKVKLVHGNNYKLGNKDLVDPVEGEAIPINKQVEALEDAIREVGNEGSFLADRLIKWKPELSESEYLALDPENETHMKVKALIDANLTITPATPQLTLEEPKAPKA